VAGKWAADLKRDPAEVQKEIERILAEHTSAPLAGLFGEKIVNVLEVNLELNERFGAPPS
jgi:K+-transporting ATPase ATPase C chain